MIYFCHTLVEPTQNLPYLLSGYNLMKSSDDECMCKNGYRMSGHHTLHTLDDDGWGTE